MFPCIICRRTEEKEVRARTSLLPPCGHRVTSQVTFLSTFLKYCFKLRESAYFCCLLLPCRCPWEFGSRGGRPPPLGSCVASTDLHLEAEGFGPVRISPPPAVTHTRADVHTLSPPAEDEERLTFTLQQYLSFSCSSRPSLSCSSLLSSFMWGCSETLARTFSLLRRKETQLQLRTFFTSQRRVASCQQVFADAGHSEMFTHSGRIATWFHSGLQSFGPVFRSDLFISGLSDTLSAPRSVLIG